jgi:hypothetical protein
LCSLLNLFLFVDFLNHLESSQQSSPVNRIASLFSVFIKPFQSVQRPRLVNNIDRRSNFQERLQEEPSSSSSKKNKKKEITFEEKVDLDEQKELKTPTNVSFFIQLRIQEMEAKKLLVDHAVYHAEDMARTEYRISHPPKFCCDQCQESFPNAADYKTHLKDKEFHKIFLKKKINLEEKFIQIDDYLLQGDLGRHIMAYRLIHHPELGTQMNRVHAAYYDPFRPSLADPTGKRRAQLLKGAFVQGFEPSMGIRSKHKKANLVGQHQAAKRLAPATNSLYQIHHPALQDTLMDIMRCQEEFIDLVSVYNHPKTHDLLKEEGVPYGFAMVRFEYHGFSVGTVYCKGEFNGWKPEEMLCDYETSRFYLLKELPPGKYRYRFMVDGEDKYDHFCSSAPDKHSPSGFSNEVRVSNSPLLHTAKERAIPPSAMVISSKKAYFDQQQQESSKYHNLKNQSTISKLPQMSSSLLSRPPKPSEMTIVTRKKTGLTNSNVDDDSVHSQLSDGIEELFGEKGPSMEMSMDTRSIDKKTIGRINHVQGADRDAMIHRVESINLRNLGLYDDGCWALAINIRKNSFIIHLDLSFNEISDDGLQALSGCLMKLTALKTLKLNGNGFGFDGIRYLSRALASSETIQVLELCSNRLGDDSMEELCSHFLQYHESIQYLYLDSNYIGNDGMECMKEMFLHNRSLLHLSIMSNIFDHNGANSLATGLKWNAKLISLNVSNNPQIGSLGTKCLGDILFHNNTIQNLEMNNINMFSGHNLSGLQSLCYGLRKSPSLIRISLQKNGIKDYHLIDLSDAILENNKILVVDVSGNQHKNPDWFIREKFIPTHLRPQQPSIATILFRNNLFASREGKKINETMKAFKPPTHQEQVEEAEEWKESMKMKLAHHQATLPGDHVAGYHFTEQEKKLRQSGIKQSYDEEEDRPFSPYKSPVFPFRNTPFQSRPESPEYGAAPVVSTKDDNGNLKIFTDKRKNALLAVAAPPALERLLVNHIVDDVKYGHWTMRRLWRRLPYDNTEKKKQETAIQLEYERIMKEKEYMKKQMKDYMISMALYLEEVPCQDFLQTIAKLFLEYFQSFDTLTASTASSSTANDSSEVTESLAMSIKANAALSNPVYEREIVHNNQDLVDNQRNKQEVQFFRGQSFRGFLNAKEEEEKEEKKKRRDTIINEYHKIQQKLDEKENERRMKNQRKFVKKPNNPEDYPKEETFFGFLSDFFNLQPPSASDEKNKNQDPDQTKPLDASSTTLVTTATENKQSSTNKKVLSEKEKQKIRQQATLTRIVKEQFMDIHLSYLQSLFTILESGNKTLLLHPEKLEIALNMLTLPGSDSDQLQEIIDHTLIPSIERIGFHKLSTYLLLHLSQLVKMNPSKRKKLLFDTKFFHLPVKEAKSMVLYFLSQNSFEHYRYYYRLNLANKPKYVCTICQERFTSEKELQKHLAKDVLLGGNDGSPSAKKSSASSFKRKNNHHSLPRTGTTLDELLGRDEQKRKRNRNTLHKRLLLERSIYESHFLILKEIKYVLTGVYFPAYFEMLPQESLPEEYLPQVFDQMGKLGRPMTVVEPYRTVRALDVLGEYLLISIRGLTGWIRYRNGKQLFLRPLQGINWETVRIQETVTYYRVNDNLPKAIELKVRHRPDLKGEILGHLHGGEVVPCYAMIGNWLQIKYQEEDAAWILFRTDGEKEQAKEIAHSALSKVNTQPNDSVDSKNESKDNINENFLKPIRKRKIDYSSKPSVVTMGGFNESEDANYDDAIISYEINGKQHKNDTLKNPSISNLKIQFFDFIRYGNRKLKTNLNHFLLIPYILQEKILNQGKDDSRTKKKMDSDEEEEEEFRKYNHNPRKLPEENPGKYYKKIMNRTNLSNQFEQFVLRTPFEISQQELFDIIIHEMNDLEIFNFFLDIGLVSPATNPLLNDPVALLGRQPPSPPPKKSSLESPTKPLKKKSRNRKNSLFSNDDASSSTTPSVPVFLSKLARRYKSEKIHIKEDGEADEDYKSDNPDETEEQQQQKMLLQSLSQKLQENDLKERNKKIQEYFGKNMKDDIYEELIFQDSVFDDIDLMSI